MKIVASRIEFKQKRLYGMKIYFAKDNPDISIIYDESQKKYFIRLWENDEWQYVQWDDAVDGFRTISDVESYMLCHDWKNATKGHIDVDESAQDEHLKDYKEAMTMLGFSKINHPMFADEEAYGLLQQNNTDTTQNLQIRTIYYSDVIAVDYWINGKRLPDYKKPKETADISKTIKNIEKMLTKYGYSVFSNCSFNSISDRQSVMAAINTKNLANDLVRVRSSNIWSYGLNLRDRKDKTGDLLVQFKGKNGGAGDVYIYYDVPTMVYRRWQSALSKGHYVWVYIRNNFKYSKLTGDKRGKLANAIN